MNPPADALNTIVVAIDGLRAAALGAYGATAHPTPAFDRLAAESTTHDDVYADSVDTATLYARLASAWSAGAPIRSLLVTDDAETPAAAFAESFGERTVLDPPEVGAPAATTGETTQAAVWAGFAAALADAVADSGNHDRPLFAWLHTRGLYGPWDAPEESYASLVDEDDTPVSPSAAPATGEFPDNASAEACEARFAASCRYAGQVATIDACLDGWLDVVDGLFEGSAVRVVVAGLRGYPLGEHGQIGGVDGRLYSEQLSVPVLVRATRPADRFARVGGPRTLTDALAKPLATRASPASNAVVLRSTSASVVVERDRLLRAPATGDPPELYVKPDDRWDQNDIASLERERVDRMLAACSGAPDAPDAGESA